MSSIVSGLFGGKSNARDILDDFTPAGFSSAGLRGTFANNTFSLQRTPQMQRTLAGIRAGFEGRAAALRDRAAAISGQIPTLQGIRGNLSGLRPGLADLRGDIQGLRSELRPGFGRLTRSRVEELRGLRGRAVGNLREELSRRRVLGSSFAAREIGALEAEFAQEEDRIRAESFLAELDATNQLIQQELGIFGAEAGIVGQEFAMALQEAGLVDLSNQSLVQAFDSSIAGAQAELQQLNMETSLAAGLSQVASQLINSNLTAQAEAQAAHEAGAAEFLGTVIGAFAGGAKKAATGGAG